jgi:ribonucleoside-triphosphate reductase (thioredoxin)
MEISNQILSDITVFMKYAKYIPELNRRETFDEIVERNMNMHVKKYPELKEKIEHVYNNFVRTKKVLPSMRSLQFAGKPIEINPARIYNCCYLPIDSIDSFGEVMFLLLSGTGVGYSVQTHHVDKLPEIRKPNPNRKKRFLVGDSIEGWADSIKFLMKSYFGKNTSTPIFDFSDIRPKGAKLLTSGGKAPGAGPLRECLVKVQNILDVKEDGDRLSSIEVHDIVCHLADAVLAGGIRRAALISLFNADDNEMLSAKAGSWWENNPQRGRANNSAVLLRHKITKEFFLSLWERVEASNSGEPGIFFTNDKDWGTNPCAEIALRPYQFCNLCEINASTVESQEDINERARAAAFIGTLQAGYTDFHYLRDVWRRTTEKDALIGVGMTGIADGAVLSLSLEEASKEAIEENKETAELLGINPAARTTTVKPSGTSSLVLGTASGVHARHNDYYIRRIRVGKEEAIYQYLKDYHLELVEDEYFRPETIAVISIPQKSPDGARLRTEPALDTLERVKKMYTEWIKPGHVKGENTHNVSCTISLKPEEWEQIGEWMWANRKNYAAVSVLPYDGGTYVQAPFEDCSEEKYNEMMATLMDVDLRYVNEEDDLTDLQGELACVGGSCEIA